MEGRIWQITGSVQGVGYRPWVYRLATQLGILGCVRNTPQGVTIEAIAPPEQLEKFSKALKNSAPPSARIKSIKEFILSPDEQIIWTYLSNSTNFRIESSDSQASDAAFPQIAPDLAMCKDCLAEIQDPNSRRFRYPFTTCAYCGPRYTIFLAPPFDRQQTVMQDFPLCPECREEYDNPSDRRFHAQAVSCPRCGPHLQFLDNKGKQISTHEQALENAGKVLREGAIVASLGIGGFHLLVRADSPEAVHRLRVRKHRPWKPLAIMCREVSELGDAVKISPIEREILHSVEAPIVLLEKTGKPPHFVGIADGSPCLGVMLASTPLYWLLLENVGVPLVATSGNISDSPICYTIQSGLQQLAPVADYFLVHNRRIVRRCDDSVIRVISEKPRLIRRARGFVPISLELPLLENVGNNQEFLGVGGHQKSCLCLLCKNTILPSAHLGDLTSSSARLEWHKDFNWLLNISQTKTPILVRDLHPDYGSTIEAEKIPLPSIAVQHHVAHAFAALAETNFNQAIAVVWDGTGLGTNGEIWGGEFLRVNSNGSWQRIAHLSNFLLPGGELAAVEPIRSAAGMLAKATSQGILDKNSLHSSFPQIKSQQESKKLELFLDYCLDKKENCLQSTSAGRLFDGIAYLLGLVKGRVSESQAATATEACAATFYSSFHNSLAQTENEIIFSKIETKNFNSVFLKVDTSNSKEVFEVYWPNALLAIISENDVPKKAFLWHLFLAKAILAACQKIKIKNVILTGGCFQNKLLAELSASLLTQNEFKVHLPELLPCNDGGLSAGQVIWGALNKTYSLPQNYLA